MARIHKSFRFLLEACRNSRFVDFKLDDKLLREVSFSPIGKILRDNLRNEWDPAGGSMASASSVPVYCGKHNMSLSENFKFLRQNNSTALPVGVMVERMRTNQSVPLGNTFSMELSNNVELHTTYLVPRQMANQFIYQLQRQRKIWWMRLSVDPGRFYISDMRHNKETKQVDVSICAKFLEAPVVVELERLELNMGELDEELAETVYECSQNQPPAVIHVRNDLDRAAMAILMDVLETPSQNQCVKIHRKIAPLKCGIVSKGQDNPGVLQDLTNLSKHLTYEIRAAKLSVLNCLLDDLLQPKKSSYEQQISLLDSIGVPYTLVLSYNTLQDGLLQLRSRDTTLSETIHVADLPRYLVRIINA